MSVLVQMRVRVDDVDRLKAAYEQRLPQIGEMGGKSIGLYSAENDPNEVSLLEEWSPTTTCTRPPRSTEIGSMRRPAPRARTGRLESGTKWSEALRTADHEVSPSP
jgi:hypothetical protein